MQTLIIALFCALVAAAVGYRKGYTTGIDDGYEEGFTDCHEQRCLPKLEEGGGFHKKIHGGEADPSPAANREP